MVIEASDVNDHFAYCLSQESGIPRCPGGLMLAETSSWFTERTWQSPQWTEPATAGRQGFPDGERRSCPPTDRTGLRSKPWWPASSRSSGRSVDDCVSRGFRLGATGPSRWARGCRGPRDPPSRHTAGGCHAACRARVRCSGGRWPPPPGTCCLFLDHRPHRPRPRIRPPACSARS